MKRRTLKRRRSRVLREVRRFEKMLLGTHTRWSREAFFQTGWRNVIIHVNGEAVEHHSFPTKPLDIFDYNVGPDGGLTFRGPVR